MLEDIMPSKQPAPLHVSFRSMIAKQASFILTAWHVRFTFHSCMPHVPKHVRKMSSQESYAIATK